MDFLKKLQNFDLNECETKLWTFKGTTPKINGHWIETTDGLDVELINVIKNQLETVTEEIEYGHLAQNNGSSVLKIPNDETDVSFIFDEINDNSPKRKTRNVKTLRNASFYVLRVSSKDGVIIAARKTDTSWGTKKANSILSVVYTDKELDIAADDGFRIERNFDFFSIDDQLLIANKGRFESILSYRAAHENDFADLLQTQEFISVFSELESLKAYIGTNRIQLRRISAIKSKKFYCDPIFMENLRKKHKEFGLNIIFDDAGKIVPTSETCRDIMTALLDHRLRSGLSGKMYDVPDATLVKLPPPPSA